MLFSVVMSAIVELDLLKDSFDFFEVVSGLVTGSLYFEIRNDFDGLSLFIEISVSFVSRLRFLVFRSGLKGELLVDVENDGSSDRTRLGRSTRGSRVIFCF